MEVAKAELVETEHPLTKEKYQAPRTFFSLDANEQMQYNSFRVERDKRNGLAREIREMDRKQGGEIEETVNNRFVELINPYLEQRGTEVARCFAAYGDSKEVMVDSPVYKLFKGNNPFDVGVEISYTFFTQNETLSCSTRGSYVGNGNRTKTPARAVVHDLIERIIEGTEQDGIKKPIVKFRGDFLYFSSTDFALPLMGFIKDILGDIGPGAMEELTVLHAEYMREYNDRLDRERTEPSIKEKVFREAYERKVEIELVKAGFLEQKLISIKSNS